MANEGYYSQDEAMKKLALKQPDLQNLVREGKLREFRVEGKPRYKTGEIDALAAELNPMSAGGLSDEGSSDTGSESAIELLPADASDGGTDVVSLEETGDQLPPADLPKKKKEDSRVKPAGVNVFDDEDLAGMDADPMAKTQIAPSVSEEMAVESGGGSGLLDMTRESDDTSLGAELLDEIYSGDETQPAKVPPEVAQAEGFEQAPEPAMPAQRVVVQVEDPLVGMFTGMLVASAILLMFAGFVGAGLVAKTLPGFIADLAGMWYLWLIIAVVVAGAASAVGFVLGKRAT